MGMERVRSRCVERLDALADSADNLIDLRLGAIEELQRAVGFDRWCALLTDPDTLQLCRGLGYNDWRDDIPRINQLIGAGLDVNNHVTLARTNGHVASLHDATGGDYVRCPYWREVSGPHGCGDELRVAFVDTSGSWGVLFLHRSSDDRPFDEREAQVLRDAGRVFTRALRRGAVAAVADPIPCPTETAVVMVDDEVRPLTWTPSAPAWCETLNPEVTPLPQMGTGAVWAAVGRVQAHEDGRLLDLPARLRIRTASGGWALIEAVRVEGGGPIAVTIRRARSEEVFDLVARAYGLSRRERDVIECLMAGEPGAVIAERLFISRYTVEDHIKAALEKVGVRSRRQLTSALLAL